MQSITFLNGELGKQTKKLNTIDQKFKNTLKNQTYENKQRNNTTYDEQDFIRRLKIQEINENTSKTLSSKK